jgi:hypothetical protein
LSIPNVLLDAFDLMCNHRDIGWSWSSKPSPREEHACPSIPGILAQMLLKFVAFDTAHYLMQYTRPSLNVPTGDTLFDPSLSPIPRYAKAAFLGNCSAIVVYTSMDVMYHFAFFFFFFLESTFIKRCMFTWNKDALGRVS